MAYCHKCGKKFEEKESFCENCGTKLREFVEDVKEKVEEVVEEVEEVVHKVNYGKLVFFIIIIALIGYIVLDVWAMTQLTPVISVGSVFTSIGNADADVSLSKTHASTTIRLENPTFVPIYFARIAYDANYGNTKVADGKTGFFVIGAHSQADIPADLTIYHLNTLKSGAKWVWNAITGKQERKYANIYIDMGITKIKIATIE